MSGVTREVMKFLSGYAAAKTIGHWWMAIWGRHLLPIDMGWFTFTPAINAFAVAFWTLALIGLVYVAWFRRDQSTSRTSSADPDRFVGGRSAAA
jgi:hypothetical protein